MKFWELISGFRTERAMLDAVFAAQDWGEFNDWYARYSSLVAQQDRSILDAPVPDALAYAVASASKQTFCLSPDGVLRTWPSDAGGRILTAVEVLEQFGGGVIEEVHEYGSAEVGG